MMKYTETCELLVDCWGTGASVTRMIVRYQMHAFDTGELSWETLEILSAGCLDAPDCCQAGSSKPQCNTVAYLR